jgi:hypothetical protein
MGTQVELNKNYTEKLKTLNRMHMSMTYTNIMSIYIYNILEFKAGLWIRIRINLSCWIRISIPNADPDPEGLKWPQK